MADDGAPEGAGDADERGAEGGARRAHKRVELLAAVVLGLAATLTAFAAYRGALVSDEVLVGYSEGARLQAEANDTFSLADQRSNLDQTLFLQYAIQAVEENEAGVLYLRGAMNPDLLALVEEWEATEDDLALPFSDKYEMFAELESQQILADGFALLDAAEAERKAANDADEQSDIYELSTVFFAVTLFLAGVAALIDSTKIALGILGIAGVMMTVGLVVVVQAETFSA